jgi:hypothetical protein
MRNVCLCTLLALWLGCSDSSQNSTTAPDDVSTDVPIRTADTAPPPVTGSVQGRLVSTSDAPIAGAYVLVCNAAECVSGETNADGKYDVVDLDLGPYKVQALVSGGGFVDMDYHQEVVSAEPTVAEKDIVAVDAVEDPIAWPKDTAGDVVVAAGALRLTALPDDLKYPLGLEQVVHAAPVDAQILPPYDETPWVGKEAQTLAFHINPVGLKTKETAFTFAVLGAGAAEGTQYDVWAVDSDWGKVHPVGTATANANDEIVSDAGGTLMELTTLILAPK